MLSFLFIFLQIASIAHSAWDDNQHRVGITQQGAQGGPNIATSNIFTSIDYSFGWDDVEPSNNKWNWSKVESGLDDLIKEHSDISVVFKPNTGYTAPLWLYDPPINVPKVYLKNSITPETTPWPYYLNKNYQTYFERYISKVYEWIINSKYYPKTIFVTQAMYGTTGDDSPWHGEPINSSYDISSEQWWGLDQKFSKYAYSVYYNQTDNNTAPYLLLLFNFGSNDTRQEWATDNCPGSYRKNGQASHGYQLNKEYDDYMSIGNISRNTIQNVNGQNVSIRFRGESNSDPQQAGGWWKEAPYWNTFTLLQWQLTYGNDFPGFSSGQIDNKSLDISFDFFNYFDKFKHANNDVTGAFIGLRDGLDSDDTKRFPESEFGAADINNSDRMVKIAQNMSEWGAKQEDPSHCTGGPMQQRKATKMNDVGFGIWPYNYAKFITQINPMGTSQGQWRIGDMNNKEQIYGRFGRSFYHKKGKDIMCFIFNKLIFGGLPLKKSVNIRFNVTYFDTGDGKWSFGYDSQNNKNKISESVQKTNEKKWLIKNFDISDAYFGQRGNMNSDFCLYNNDTNDDTIFSFIQAVVV